MKKVTKEVFETVRVNSKSFNNDLDDLTVISGLSKRTIKNILKAPNYQEYRNKFCKRKDKEPTVPANCEFDVAEDLSLYFGELTIDHKLISRLVLINLVVTVIGLSIIIAMIVR